MGSRDIDVGFHIDKTASATALQKSSLVQSINILEQLKFKSVSFRMYKEIHTETEREINDGQVSRTPSHFVFPMYVDLIVDNISSTLKEIIGFTPIDEPLLELAFTGESALVKEFEKKVLLPSAPLLLAMKINSLPQRQKDHKKTKDLCDIFALLWYADVDMKTVKEELLKITTKNNIQKCLRNITNEDLETSASQMNHNVAEISRVLRELE